MSSLQLQSSELPLQGTSNAPSAVQESGGSADQSMRNMKEQVLVAQTVLQQAVGVIEQFLTSDEQLSVNSKYLPGSTIGKHLRHANDHFRSLIQLVNTQSPDSYTLDYDRSRTRNSPMETDLGAARETLIETIKQLGDMANKTEWNAPVVLRAITPYDQEMQSTLGREVVYHYTRSRSPFLTLEVRQLWFASLHCVHHWSMVRVIAGEMGITLSEDFGFAPSTLVHQGREAPLGKPKI
ncbi:hypothetical protein V5O48_002209 [Marasmius crinis-equi]|uniref:DinB-like domain-containing protein n=1 Tax=Marasmius crinis-equi TaxID=585013 RepID=A0ABR3FWL8_9AGAR